MKIRFMQMMDVDIQFNVSKYELTHEHQNNGWRLPTLNDMIMVFNDQSWNTNINLENCWYLIDQDSEGKKPFDSSLPVGFYQYQFDFSTGEHGWRDCTEDNWGLANVRLIRSEIPIAKLEHNGNSISNLILQACDMGEMTWPEAQSAIIKLGDGWRLPSIDELDLIYGASELCRKEKDFNLSENEYYWAEEKLSGSQFDGNGDKAAIYFRNYEPDTEAGYYNNFDISEKFRVRAIKSLN
jgi:hypothetical protein